MISDKNDSLKGLGSYLNILGGLSAILAAIGYISVRFHNEVLGVELDVAARDFIYFGGMFFYNTFFAILLSTYKLISGTNLFLPSLTLFILFLLHVLKNYTSESPKRVASLSWMACGILLFIEGLLVIDYCIKSMPEQNVLYLGKDPHDQFAYGSLAIITILYSVTFWNLRMWQKTLDISSFFIKPIVYICGFLLVMQLLIVPIFYGGLSNPNKYPIMILDYDDNLTYKVAILGEQDNRWIVAYDYPLKKVLLLDKNKIQKMECLGIKNIFELDNYNKPARK